MKAKLTNKDTDFYTVLGPIFGSRKVEKETGDRFYDDDKKEWYISFGENHDVISVVSIAKGVIKNVYTSDINDLTEVMREIYPLSGVSVAPSVYIEAYKSAGYIIKETDLKKFVKIQGGIENGKSLI